MYPGDDTAAEYMSDQTVGDYEYYDEASSFEYSTRRDGWWAAILLGSIIFSPEMIISRALPPFRPADFVILFLLLVRLVKTTGFYGGFLFSYRIRLFSLFMFAMVSVLLFSLMVNVASGRYLFYYKDLFVPIVFIRMVVIAAIAASFNLGQRQIKQVLTGVLIISFGLVILAFGQRARLFGVGPLMKLIYNYEMERPTRDILLLRVCGTFGNPNVFGGCLVMLAAVSLAFAINVKGIIRLMSMIVYIGLVVAMVLTTASRTAFISLVVVSAGSLVLSARRGSRIPTLILAILIVGVLIFVRENVHDLPINPRLKMLITRGGPPIEESLSARIAMWQRSLATARESIFWGVGATKTVIQLTDNGYIFTLLRIGIIGLIIYLSMLSSLFIRGIRALYIEYGRLQRAALLGLIMVLVSHALFEVTGEFFWNIRYGAVFAMFVGLLCGLSGQTSREYNYQRLYSGEVAESQAY